MRNRTARRRTAALLALALAIGAAACARQAMVLEIEGSVMYDKPRIAAVSHAVTDLRRDGGQVIVQVTMTGDPGLTATFDISPGVADREPMTEAAAGTYTGRFAFPLEVDGGPYTILGRLRHEQAGEVIRRDPAPVIIPLLPRIR